MTGTLRTRIVPAALVALVCAAVTGAVFVVGGPLAIILYPLLVFGPIAAAAGDEPGLRVIRPARSSPCGTGRARSACCSGWA